MSIIKPSGLTHAETTPAAPQQSSRWVLALTILTGQITLAFSMFAVAVAMPNIMSAIGLGGEGARGLACGGAVCCEAERLPRNTPWIGGSVHMPRRSVRQPASRVYRHT